MNELITIREVESCEEIAEFWRERDEYMIRDVFPNDTLGEPLTQNDLDWFLSKEYKDHMMEIFYRNQDKAHFVFFEENDEKIGFCSYVTYFSEDNKCFIIDYCIKPEFRRQGYGKACFRGLKERETKKGADYFELNISNEGNRSFWASLGFEHNGFDEYGSILYQLKPAQCGEITYEVFQIKDFDQLKQLMAGYKKAIGEELLTNTQKASLRNAIENHEIFFFVAKRKTRLIGMCSVSLTFSTYQCKKSGVFEDFYILPVYQNRGIATSLTECVFYWCDKHDITSLWVGSSKGDIDMYQHLGFGVQLGSLLAWSSDKKSRHTYKT